MQENPFQRFRKYYGHYLLGIIIPALINGLSIPLFKNELGAKDYGQYALYFNAMLISNLLVSGWLSQAILRFYAKAGDKKQFARQVISLSIKIGAIAFLPAVWIVYSINGSIITAFIFGVLLWLAAVQLPLQSLSQSSFLSKAAAGAEAVRTISWLVLSIIFLRFGIPFLQALLSAIALSYFFSIVFLYRKNKVVVSLTQQHWLKGNNLPLNFYKYGWPFSLWFICYYLSGYIDKLFILKSSGSYLQGNYNAIYDFISKSAGLILAPVLTAAVPLLTETFEQKQFAEVRKLIIKLISIELVVLVVLVAAYYAGGYQILLWLLRIPHQDVYIHAGAIIVVGTMLWQIALLIQKPAELKYKSLALFIKIGVAIAAQYAFYLFFPYSSPLLFPIGYCLAALVYACFTLISNFRIT